MRWNCLHGLVFAGLFAWALGSAASAATPLERARIALGDLHRWLGTDDNGMRWREFLKSSELAAELDKGILADRDVVQSVITQYASGESGLDQRRFVAVRDAVLEWSHDLARFQDGLSQSALTAKTAFRPATTTSVDQARRTLQAEMRNLESFLDRGSRDNANAWKEYLRWDALKSSVDDKPNIGGLQNLLEQYQTKEKGLNLAPFVRVRRAIQRYADAALFADERTKELFEERLDELAKRLRNHAYQPNNEDAVFIGRTLDLLQRTGHAPWLVEAIHRRYWRPNLLVQVSENMMNSAMSRDVNEVQNVNENILGTAIRGQARLRGRVNVSLVPSNDRAVLSVLLGGTAYSDSIGYNRKFRICSEGETSLCASKQIFINESGLTSTPAAANAHMQTQITGIGGARLRLMRKIVRKKAEQMKPQAEQIAAGKAAEQLSERFDNESAGMLSDANSRFHQAKNHELLRRFDAHPRSLQFSTTSTHLHFAALATKDDQLAAPGSPPALAGAHDVLFHVHESMVGNVSEYVLGNFTLTDARLVELMKENKLEVPDELQPAPGKEAWSITFAASHPVRVHFAGQRLAIGIRGKRFTRGDQKLNRTIEISGTYRFEVTPTGPRLFREGDVNIDLGVRSLGVQQLAMKTFMQRKFDAMFRKEIDASKAQLPEQVRQLKLQFREMHANDGWLSVALGTGGMASGRILGASPAATPTTIMFAQQE